MKLLRVIILILPLFCKLLLAQGYLALVGGGSEDYNSWSDPVYSWMVEKGDSGKVVILATSSQSSWLPNYFVSLGAQSAQNLVFANTSQANDTSLTHQVRQARVVFIKGGDQYEYYSRWKGTDLQNAIEDVYQSGGVVAGTSAGAMILSEIIYTAAHGTVYPYEALQNPYNYYMTLENDFFHFLPDIIVDTHVIERGRTGRMLGFLARWNTDHNADILAVGVDDLTGLLVNPDRTAEVRGSGAVTFFWQSPRSEVVCQNGQPLHFTEVQGCQLTAGYRFDLDARQVVHIPSQATLLTPGAPPALLPAGTLTLQGGEDFNWQSAPGRVLENFLQSNPGLAYLTILCDISSNAFNRAQQYGNWFSTQGTDTVQVKKIYSGNVNDPQIIQAVERAEALVLVGVKDNYAGQLLNGSNGLSAVFQNRAAAGVPLLWVGVDARFAGPMVVTNTEGNPNNLAYGNIGWKPAAGVWPHTVVMSRAFDDNNYFENRVGGLLWGLFKAPRSLGVLIDEHTTLTVSDSVATVAGETPVIFIDASQATSIDSSRVKIGSAANFRQCAAIDRCTWHVVAPGRRFNWAERFSVPVGIRSGVNTVPGSFRLSPAYPNPFNGGVSFTYETGRPGRVGVRIYDLLGRIVHRESFYAIQPAGRWMWQPRENLSSGAYLLQFSLPGEVFWRRVVLVR